MKCRGQEFVSSEGPAVLSVKNLKVRFGTSSGHVHAVNDIDFSLSSGELLGVVGESGSGKSVTMMSLLGLLPSPPAQIASGEVLFEGRNLLNCSQKELREIRGRSIGIIFQDPLTSLNPVFTVGFQLMEPLRKHMGLSKSAARSRAMELLDLVGISDPKRRLGDYPYQFSGGMRQRVMIAIALACDPKILIADEPTTALDVTIQAQILELIRNLRQKMGMAIIWITHDLGVIAGIANRIIVMYAGQIVEQAPVDKVFYDPRHPYTKALLTTIPTIRRERASRLNTIRGQAATPLAEPQFCSFSSRCPLAFDQCTSKRPVLKNRGPNHYAACHLLDLNHPDD